MELEWDEAKREANLVKHGFDFREAWRIVDGRWVTQRSPYPHEERWLLTGPLHGRHVTIVYTMRGELMRIISMRRARVGEERGYQTVYGRGAEEAPEQD
jgi:uncharacterized protein